MGVVLGLLLFVIGALAARDILGEKVPPAKKILDSMSGSIEIIGLAGVFIGIVWFLYAISMVRYFDYHPLLVLEGWLASALMIVLGFLLSVNVMGKMVGEPHPAFFVKIKSAMDGLAPYTKHLGLAGIVVGIIYIV